jgi:DNA-binding transcriptional ArsR family regulator
MQVRDNSTSADGNSISVDMRPLFAMHAEMCQALANQHRLAIMYMLKDGERCVGDMAAELGISVHNVSQHLRILRQRLLVRSRKDGQTVYYSVTNPKFIQACGLIREALVEEHSAEGESLRAAGLADFLNPTPGPDAGTGS